MSGQSEQAPSRRIRLTPASAFKIRPVRWVWDNRIPLGEITLVPGREGVGKSTFLAWMAAAITNGNLPGRFRGEPRAVLYAATEDSWSYTIAPRLLAAGANMHMVFRIDVEQEDGSTSGLILPRDCAELPAIAAEVNAAVLMCDPIMSMVDEKLSTFKAQELRKALEPLKKYAEKAGIAVVALVHFNKGTTSDVGTLIAGARAWAEVARAVIGIARDQEEDEYTCVVSQVKNNLGRTDLPHLAYTIDGVALETDEGEDAHVGRLRWTGESERSVEDILGAAASGEDRRHGDAMKRVIAHVTEESAGRRRALSTADIVAAFDGELKPEHVRKILTRAVSAGQVQSPARGLYLVESSVTKLERDAILSQTGNAPSGSSIPPTVTVSQVSQQQVRGGLGGVTNGSGSCHNEPDCHTLVDQLVTSDVVTVGTGAVTNPSGRRGTVHPQRGSDWLRTDTKPLCVTCRQPLDLVLAASGDTAHPTCVPLRSAS